MEVFDKEDLGPNYVTVVCMVHNKQRIHKTDLNLTTCVPEKNV